MEGIFNNLPLNKHPVILKKISFSEIPKIKFLKEHAEDVILCQTPKFKPYIQIFNKNQIEYNSFEVK